MEYASKSVGTAGLTTGIIGTALGAAATGILPIFGGGAVANAAANGGFVSRETFDLSLKLSESERSNAILAAELNTEKKMVEVFNALNDKINGIEKSQAEANSAQAVTNCAVTSNIAVMQNNIAQLLSLTKMVIPNGNVCPGWGNATVSIATTPATT